MQLPKREPAVRWMMLSQEGLRVRMRAMKEERERLMNKMSCRISWVDRRASRDG